MGPYNKLKKLADISVAIFLLIVLFFPILIFGLIIFFELNEFPFYIQERGLSFSHKRFRIYKLKTIGNQATKKIPFDKNRVVLSNPKFAPSITRFCKFLRKTGLDELPQLINIIKGDMSFVGPRPLMIADLVLMKENYNQWYLERERITCKPGLTGLWQVFCDRSMGVFNLIELDRIYNKKKSFMLDMTIIFHTLKIVFTAKNKDAILHYIDIPSEKTVRAEGTNSIILDVLSSKTGIISSTN